jgi:O-antigen/teichoic acid export membrane protein
MFPVFSKRYAEKTDSLNFAFEECFKILAVLSVPLVILLFFFAEDIIILFFTEKLIESIPVFKVLSIAWGFMFVSVLLTDTLIAIGKQELMTWCIGLALAVNLVLALILIPLTGFVGAGMAALVAEVVLCVSAYRLISRHLVRLPLGRLLTGPTIGGLVLIFCCYWGARTLSFAILLLIIVLGLICYMGSLIMCKTLTRKEYEWAKEIFRTFLVDTCLRNRKNVNPGNKEKGWQGFSS